jgi:hypothetical protein
MRKTGKLTAYIFIFAAAWLVVAGICYLTGNLPGYYEYDSKITAFYVCLDNTEFEQASFVTNDIETLYFCGVVEGTTDRGGMMYLFRENSVIFQKDVQLELGTFFLPVNRAQLNGFTPGNYHVEIRYSRQILAQTNFIVTSSESP